MSRLYAEDPIARLLAGNRFFRQPAEPATTDLLPPLSPEEQQSALGRIMEQGLGGLSYAGKVIDKPARAVRGVLGGNLNEALAALPLSDTLGLTHEEDTASGRQLLQNAGLVGQGDPTSFDWGDAAGIGAEMALDPLTYLTFGAGALSKTALAAKKAGQPYQKSLIGLGLPFSQPSVTFGEGMRLRDVPGIKQAAGVVSGADQLAGRLTGVQPSAVFNSVYDPIKRQAAALFDPAVKGTVDARAQDIARTVISPGEKAAEATAGGLYKDVLQRLDPFLGHSDDADRGLLRMLTASAENVGQADPLKIGAKVGANWMKGLEYDLTQHFTPQEVAQIQKIGGDLNSYTSILRADEASKGVKAPSLQDDLISYFTRRKQDIPRQPGETLFSYRNRAARDYAAEHASQIGREDIFRNIPGGTDQINQLAKDATLKAVPLDDAVTRLTGELTGLKPAPAGFMGPQIPGMEKFLERDAPQVKQIGEFADWVRGLPDVHAQQGVDFFSPDAPLALFSRLNRSAKATTAADALTEAARKYGATKQAIAQAGEKAVSLPEATAKFKMGNDGIAAIADALGVSKADAAKLHLPEGLFNDLAKVNEAWQKPKVVQPVLQAIDYVQNLFKTNVTVPFAGFHARNLADGVVNMWRDQGFSEGGVFKTLKKVGPEALDLLRGKPLDRALPGMAGQGAAEWTQQLDKELIQHVPSFRPRGNNPADLVGNAGENILRRPGLPEASGKSVAGDVGDFVKKFVPKSLGELNPLNVAGAAGEADRFAPAAAGRAASKFGQEWVELTHYLGLRQNGYAPEAAGKLVAKYQRDYSNLTDFEKNVMRRIFPWYGFTKTNLLPIASDLAEQPGKLSAMTRVLTGGRDKNEFIPQYVAEGASLPVPGAPDGQQRYVTGFGTAIEDEAVKALSSLAHGDLTRFGQSVLGMTRPELKAPLEAIFDKQLYSGRPLSELRPYEFANLGGLLDPVTARRATEVLSNTPASRFLSTVNRAVDERKGTPETLLNTLTGVRVSDVDVTRARDAAAKQVVGEMLKGLPGVKTTSDIYIPKEQVQQGLDPMEAVLYRLYLGADQRLRDQAKVRREAAR